MNKPNLKKMKNDITFIKRNGNEYCVQNGNVYIKSLIYISELEDYLNYSYLQDLTSLSNSNEDIMIIKDMKGNIIWEREEIWESVPIGANVLVSNNLNQDWKARKFVRYSPNMTWKFKVLSDDLTTLEDWKYCKLMEE